MVSRFRSICVFRKSRSFCPSVSPWQSAIRAAAVQHVVIDFRIPRTRIAAARSAVYFRRFGRRIWRPNGNRRALGFSEVHFIRTPRDSADFWRAQAIVYVRDGRAHTSSYTRVHGESVKPVRFGRAKVRSRPSFASGRNFEFDALTWHSIVFGRGVRS